MTDMNLKIGRLWAGTETELHNLLTRLEAVTPEVEAQIDAKRAAAESGGDQRSSRLVARSGTTGVVNISGSLVNDDDELLMITARGKLQRMAVNEISIIGRNTQGVRIMAMDEEDTLAAVVRVPRDESATPSET